MRIIDLISPLLEGGWESQKTQDTVINPATVVAALSRINEFTDGLNAWLTKNGHPNVAVGSPLGSTAHHEVDAEDAVYGDIDLQMKAPDIGEGKTPSQFAAHWNQLVDLYIAGEKPNSIYDTGKPANGHVIVDLDGKSFVQVDLLWTPVHLADWMRYRMTPPQGVKGATYGNLFSTLGEIANMSIQAAGVQMKIRDGLPMDFSKTRKYDRLVTLSTDPKRFGLEMLSKLFRLVNPNADPSSMKVDPELARHPGVDPSDINARNLVSMIKGLGRSFELNGMFGKYNLRDIPDYESFIRVFREHYMEKIRAATMATKFDKASTPDAIKRAEEAKHKLISHSAAIMDLF